MTTTTAPATPPLPRTRPRPRRRKPRAETTAAPGTTAATDDTAADTTAGEGTTAPTGTGEPGVPGALEGLKGTTPLVELSSDFTDRLLEVDPALIDFNYAAETYDATVIIALAVEQAQDDGIAYAELINGITRDGEKCTDFATCKAILEAEATLISTASPDRWSSPATVSRWRRATACCSSAPTTGSTTR